MSGASTGASIGAGARRRPSSLPSLPVLLGGGAYVLVMAALAAWAAWPIYRSSALLVLAAVATFAGLAIAGAAARWSWPGWLTAVVTGAALLVVGVPLAVPSALDGGAAGGLSGILAGVRDVLLGLVTAWKDLVTVQLPVGEYRNLLVPALVVFLIGTLLSASFAWRSARAASFAVLVGLGMVTFGLGFGASTASAPIVIGPLTLVAPRESAIGAAALVASLVFLAQRAAIDRAGALRRAAARGGAKLERRGGAVARRRLLAGGMVAVAVAAALVVPAAAQSLPREVLRTGIGPEREVRAAVSPLAQYRAFFTDDAFDTTLFTVTAEGPLPSRVRLATLDAYDGETFRGAPGVPSGAQAAPANDAAPFTRVPSRLDPAPGAPSTVRIEIAEYGEIWMPMAGSLESVRFSGPRPAALADAFYYSADRTSGVQIAGGGLEPGDAYELRVTLPEERTLATLTPGAAGAAPPGAPVPERLVEWMEAQDAGVGGPALAALVERLRARGYLSRALAAGDDEQPARWTMELGDYAFQPSAAGHSLARIDALFAQLLEREGEVGGGHPGGVSDAPDAALVAGIGDEEQFATAVALIAQQLGFPARVVVGARLDAAPGLSHCDAGACRAGDMSAWAEVRDADGAWVAVDVTPQHAATVDRDAARLRDPEHATQVRPATAEEVVPPPPVQHDSALPPDDAEGAPLDLGALWATLRVLALVALVAALLLGPFVTVVAAKALRRRARRGDGDPASRIVGGWDEYVDGAVDLGHTAPGVLTRSELAAHFARDRAAASTAVAGPAQAAGAGAHVDAGAQLAELADRAVFAPEPPRDEDAAHFWRMVEAERATRAAGVGAWQRLRAAVSLRSFARYLAPSKAARTRANVWLHERRTRARDASAQRS
ncbi:MAG TPA: transglutaminase-like domain-containing protein [Microbacteriaceae bacterium]|nr:transglutaminase-like domain-containing protein [Microbacteriaceae bacterium]HPZ33866.1 transglutaminase-like domain-containing protein [Microbacteriaceae bacterium]HQC92965.1 transglutaminase-like domain-containing protein [Microbacteriaceae bacterium]